VFDVNLSAHGLHALDVLVHRPRADGAAAGQRHRGFAKARQQWPQSQHRGAHGFDQFIGRFGRTQGASVKRDGAGRARAALGAHAHVADQLEHGGHVLQAGHVLQRHAVGGQQGRTQFW